MNIAYLNINFRENTADGGSTHIREFVNEVTNLGHEIYSDRSNHHPKVIHISKGIISRIMTLKKCDVFYTRYQGEITHSMRFTTSTMRIISKKSLNVWEFNTIPSFALLKGKDEKEVENQIRFLRKQAEISDLAVCVTDKMADFVNQKLGWKKVLMVPNASNPSHFKPGLPCHPRMDFFSGNLNVVWLGSLFEQWNDFELLNKTAENLWNKGIKNVCFHLIGSFPGYISQMIPPNVFLYGAQSYHSLPNWLSAMDIGLILYKNEQATFGSPIKLFDYLSSGLAVISTTHPQVKNILNEIGFEDFALKNNTPEDLAEKILLLLENQTLLKQYKENARKIIEAKYNWRNSVNMIITTLETLLDEYK